MKPVLFLIFILIYGCAQDSSVKENNRGQGGATEDKDFTADAKSSDKNPDDLDSEENDKNDSQQNNDDPEKDDEEQIKTPEIEVPVELEDFKILLSQVDQVRQRLGVTKQYGFKIERQDNRDEDLELTIKIDNKEIEELDEREGVVLFLPETSIKLTPKSSQTFQISMTTFSYAPSTSEEDSPSIEVSLFWGEDIVMTQKIPVVIDPEFAIGIKGTQKDELEWFPNEKEILFVSHQSPLKIRFQNLDTMVNHIIHGSGDIPHQPVGNPMEPLQQGEEPDEYVAEIDSEDTQASYYSHTLESSGDSRVLLFNQ